jgi:energy-coupling factor transport system substrate-specific component
LPTRSSCRKTATERTAAHAAAAPLLTSLLIIITLVVLLVELQGQTVSAKVIAALGVLVAITAVLRILEVVFPAIGGFSPVFRADHPRRLRLRLSLRFSPRHAGNARLGVDHRRRRPLAALPNVHRRLAGNERRLAPQTGQPTLELAMLTGFGVIWGFLFGLIMNLYFWPFLAGADPTNWQPGLGFNAGFSRYLAFYATTSFVWDIGRAVGNGVLLLIPEPSRRARPAPFPRPFPLHDGRPRPEQRPCLMPAVGRSGYWPWR